MKIVVVGASSGGMEALKTLVAELPADLLAAVFVVNHLAADASLEPLLRALNKAAKLSCTQAEDGEAFVQRHVYLAPPDHHLLIGKRKMRVTKGARENRWRPGIDPLFRSAAANHGHDVIGVLLTGHLNDGTAGLLAVKRCGGIAVVQDPMDAAYADMPRSAIDNVHIDHVVPLSAMGELIGRLARMTRDKGPAIPDDVVIEAKIAERVLSDLASVNVLGDQVPFNCPNCGGVLWQIAMGKFQRYRCHTGHAYTAEALLAEQTSKIEETLWVALRMFEERKNMLSSMTNPAERAFSRSAEERIRESEVHIARIRAMLMSNDKSTGDDALG